MYDKILYWRKKVSRSPLSLGPEVTANNLDILLGPLSEEIHPTTVRCIIDGVLRKIEKERRMDVRKERVGEGVCV